MNAAVQASDRCMDAVLDAVLADCGSALGANGSAFLRRVYASGLERYRRRLSAVGLVAGRRLLDAGCGLGQWGLAAANNYDEVVGIDISETRVDACRRISRLLGITNCMFHRGSLERLAYPDGSFDAAISYSVLYFTDYVRVCSELGRVLRPGALLYVSTNDIGRFLADVIQNRNPADDFRPRCYGLATLARTLVERITGRRWFAGAIAMSRRRTVLGLRRAGFEIIDVGPEGTLGADDTPMQIGRYGGFTAVFDLLARRL